MSVTLHIAKLLEQEGFGTLDTDIFWEEASVDSKGKPKDGIWVVTRGSAVTRLQSGIQAFDIYARYANKLTTNTKLEGILKYLQESYGTVCTLPLVPPYSDVLYTQAVIQPVSSIENVGADEQDKIVKVISGEIRYSIGE